MHFFHSLNTYLLKSQSWPDTALGAKGTAANKTKLPCPLGSYTLVTVYVSERLVFVQHLKQKLLSGRPRTGKKELENFQEGTNS